MAGGQSEEQTIVISDIDGTLAHVTDSHMAINDALVNDLIQQRKQGAHIALLTGRDCEMMQIKLMLSIMQNGEDPSVIRSEISVFRQNLTINIVTAINDRAKDQGCDLLIESSDVLTSRDNVSESHYYYQRYLKDYEQLLSAYIDHLMLLPEAELLTECGQITKSVQASEFMEWLEENSPSFYENNRALIVDLEDRYDLVHASQCSAPSATHTKADVIRDYLQALKHKINKTFTKVIFHDDQKDILSNFMRSVRGGVFKTLLTHCYVNRVTPPSNENTGWLHQSSQDLSQEVKCLQFYWRQLVTFLNSLTAERDIDRLGEHGICLKDSSSLLTMTKAVSSQPQARRNHNRLMRDNSSLLPKYGIFTPVKHDHLALANTDYLNNGGSKSSTEWLTSL